MRLSTNILLSRDDFREGVFLRDKHQCVICKAPGKDAHHIIERRLFDDGGYYFDNGATLCEKHHIMAEETTLSCEEIRSAAGIKNIILPDFLYNDNDYTYDKWGNIVMPTGMRLQGELFFDESVQKILKQGDVLQYFSKYIKYPRSMHLPWSEKLSKDDRKLKNVDHFEGKEVVVTLKMDGENTSMYNDHIHARSLDSGTHPSRKWVKGLWGRIGYEIPDGWRICGENMYAVHTIQYENLSSYFYVFSIWNERNVCLSWDETVEYTTLLGLVTVPVIYRGVYDEKLIKEAFAMSQKSDQRHEGYVIRLTDEYPYGQFRKSLAKFVAGDFIIKHGHWTQQKLEVNQLRK
jgi:hypothetical protein